MAKNKTSAELRRIYQEAHADGIWLAEWRGRDECWAAAGNIEVLRQTEKKLGTKLDVRALDIVKLAHLGSVPASGKTREESCLGAIVAFFREYYRNRKK